ncbi:MAG: TonB C-terminal domain-containing protein [Casimicrobiaceae bacterium]
MALAAREQAVAARAADAARARANEDYIRRIQAKVKGYVVVPPEIAGNPEAIFDVVQLPTGEIIDTQLRKSSGNRAYDEAVQRAIIKASPLPRPDAPDLFRRNLTLKFRPLDCRASGACIVWRIFVPHLLVDQMYGRPTPVGSLFDQMAQRYRVYRSRRRQQDIASLGVLGRRHDHRFHSQRLVGTRRRRQIQPLESLSHRREIQAVDDVAHVLVHPPLRRQRHRHDALRDDVDAGLHLLVRDLVEPPHDPQQPAIDIRLPHRDQRAQRQALADAAGRGDAEPGHAAVLDLPGRIGPRREADRERIVLVREPAPAARRACHLEHLDLLRAGADLRLVVARGARPQVLADAREPDAHARRYGDRHARVAPQLGLHDRRDGRLDLAQHRQPLLIDRGDRTLIGELRFAQRCDRALHAVGQRRGVEIAQHGTAVVAGAAHQPFPSGEVDEKSFQRPGDLLQRQAPAPGAQLRARPVDLGRIQVPGVELVHEQHVKIFLLDRPVLCGRPGRGQRHRLPIALHLAGAEVGLMQLGPFPGDPALVLEYPKLRVGALEVHEAHE